MKPGRGMHAFVEIGLLCIDMTVEVQDAEFLAVHILSHPSHSRKSQRMVSPQDYWKGPARIDMADSFTDLVKGLLDIAWNGEYVAEIAHGNGLPEIHAKLKTIGAVQRGDLADALWTESGTGSIGGPAIERRPENRNVVFPALADILDIRRFGEGIDAGEVR